MTYNKQSSYITKQLRENKMELSKADNIRKEIAQNIRYNLYDDDLILL